MPVPTAPQLQVVQCLADAFCCVLTPCGPRLHCLLPFDFESRLKPPFPCQCQFSNAEVARKPPCLSQADKSPTNFAASQRGSPVHHCGSSMGLHLYPKPMAVCRPLHCLKSQASKPNHCTLSTRDLPPALHPKEHTLPALRGCPPQALQPCAPCSCPLPCKKFLPIRTCFRIPCPSHREVPYSPIPQQLAAALHQPLRGGSPQAICQVT